MKEQKNNASRTRQPAKPAEAEYGWRSFLLRYWMWAVLVLILVFAAGIRLRLLDFPLERDEGEYAYMGQLMLQGVPPYQAAYNMKFPGTYAAYALIMAAFGQTVAGIHLGVLLVNAGAIVLVFLITRRLWDAKAGLMAAAAYALMTMSQGSLGMAGHATHFVVLPMLGGVLLMLKAIERDKVWMYSVAGLLMGIAVLMKQPGVFFIPMAGLYILWVGLRRRPVSWRSTISALAVFAAGVALPLILTGLVLWWAGVFGKFWYWTVVYAKAYGSQMPIAYGPQLLSMGFAAMSGHTWPLWLLAGVGLILQCLNRNSRRQLPFVLGLTIFSFLAACPGLFFRQHYFIPLMPAVAMLIGGGLFALGDFMQRRRLPMAQIFPLLIFAGVWGYVLNAESDFLLKMDADAACRNTYSPNPFVESRDVAKYLRENTSPDDKIAVLGSEPQLYFLSQRRSVTGYIYMYPLLEVQPDALQMQKEMAGQIEAANPRYVVYVNVRFSWLPWPGSQMWILNEWWSSYQRNYDVVGRIDIFPNGSRYRWGAEASNGKPLSPEYLLVCKRK